MHLSIAAARRQQYEPDMCCFWVPSVGFWSVSQTCCSTSHYVVTFPDIPSLGVWIRSVHGDLPNNKQLLSLDIFLNTAALNWRCMCIPLRVQSASEAYELRRQALGLRGISREPDPLEEVGQGLERTANFGFGPGTTATGGPVPRLRRVSRMWGRIRQGAVPSVCVVARYFTESASFTQNVRSLPQCLQMGCFTGRMRSG